jgi:kynurenine formamidase
MPTISFNRIIHLSHIITPDIPMWTSDPSVEFEINAWRDRDGYYLRRFAMGEHSATHINAPISFHADGIGIDRYTAESLVVPSVVIDIRSQAAANPDYAIALPEILNWEQQHGQIPAASVVLLFTGWQDKWENAAAFFNYDSAGKPHFPGFGIETTQFLLTERQIAGIGIDTHGVDPGIDENFTINRLVLAKPRIVLENLTNLDRLPPTGTTLIIGILRLQDGSGSPAAVMALVD